MNRCRNIFGKSRMLSNNAILSQISFESVIVFSSKYFCSFIQDDTIYALSSGFGKCGVAVIRVSGPETQKALLRLTSRSVVPPPRKAFLSKLYNPFSNVLLDHALVLWFAKPYSFTGEDVCEFQIHGGPAVISAVLDALSKLSGLRPAEAGDFTKRAFLNNKMDLTKVEGLGDLIHAETEAQRRQALYQMEGSLSDLYNKWSKIILRCTAHMEAFLDFSEEEGLDEKLVENLKSTISTVISQIKVHISDNQRGEILRSGVRVAIVGHPNVGKSSLLNAIIQRPAAIVSPTSGTTRDVIETTLDVDGFPVVISDTAGLCSSDNAIEQEGIKRAFKKAEEADLIIFVVSSENFSNYVNAKIDICKLPTAFGLELSLPKENTLVVMNKIDLLKVNRCHFSSQIYALSCKTMEGFSDFLKVFSGKIKSICGATTLCEIPSVTQKRHRDHLDKSVEYLRNSLKFIDYDVVISTEYLRMALNEISKISGKVGAEDILDVIFKDFCIGK